VEVLDLFSCIGGHALGLRAAGPFETVQFVEYDPWRRKVLAHHFPGVPIHDDVRTFRGEPGSADVVVGGPPCQRTSVAAAVHGYRTGASLWPDMLRIIREVGPFWVVVEQPPGNRAWEAEVAGGLAGAGYHASRLVLSVEGLGGPHIRRRVFTLAHRDLSRLAVAGEAGSWEAERVARRAADRNPWREALARVLRVDARVSTRLDGHHRKRRIEAIGDSNPPVMMAVIGRAILAATG
jgi:site-specific DNA-cytosine methylase